MSKIRIRKMEVEDIEAVHVIEQLSFPETWSKEIYRDELTKNKYAAYFVILYEEEIVGFCGSWMVLDEAQITNIAVTPKYRGKGLGTNLFQYVIHYAIAHGVKRLSLEVRVSNITAQKMYKNFGFQPGGIRKNYYTDNHEDALVLWVNL